MLIICFRKDGAQIRGELYSGSRQGNLKVIYEIEELC